MIRRSPLVLGLVLGLVVLTGCDRHAATVAHPAGEGLERIRVATIDVVLDKGYTILEAPTCHETDGAVACRGTTTDGLAIEATSARDAREDMTVLVDGDQEYQGAVRAVLEDAARAS